MLVGYICVVRQAKTYFKIEQSFNLQTLTKI